MTQRPLFLKIVSSSLIAAFSLAQDPFVFASSETSDTLRGIQVGEQGAGLEELNASLKGSLAARKVQADIPALGADAQSWAYRDFILVQDPRGKKAVLLSFGQQSQNSEEQLARDNVERDRRIAGDLAQGISEGSFIQYLRTPPLQSGQLSERPFRELLEDFFADRNAVSRWLRENSYFGTLEEGRLEAAVNRLLDMRAGVLNDKGWAAFSGKSEEEKMRNFLQTLFEERFFKLVQRTYMNRLVSLGNFQRDAQIEKAERWSKRFSENLAGRLQKAVSQEGMTSRKLREQLYFYLDELEKELRPGSFSEGAFDRFKEKLRQRWGTRLRMDTLTEMIFESFYPELVAVIEKRLSQEAGDAVNLNWKNSDTKRRIKQLQTEVVPVGVSEAAVEKAKELKKAGYETAVVLMGSHQQGYGEDVFGTSSKKFHIIETRLSPDSPRLFSVTGAPVEQIFDGLPAGVAALLKSEKIASVVRPVLANRIETEFELEGKETEALARQQLETVSSSGALQEPQESFLLRWAPVMRRLGYAAAVMAGLFGLGAMTANAPAIGADSLNGGVPNDLQLGVLGDPLDNMDIQLGSAVELPQNRGEQAVVAPVVLGAGDNSLAVAQDVLNLAVVEKEQKQEPTKEKEKEKKEGKTIVQGGNGPLPGPLAGPGIGPGGVPPPEIIVTWRPTGQDNRPIALKFDAVPDPSGFLKTRYDGTTAYILPHERTYGQLVAMDPVTGQYQTVAHLRSDGSIGSAGVDRDDPPADMVKLLPAPPPDHLKNWRPTMEEGRPVNLSSLKTKTGHNGLLTITLNDGRTGYLMPHRSAYGQVVAVDPATNDYATVAYLNRAGALSAVAGGDSSITPAILRNLPPPEKAAANWRPTVDGVQQIKLKNLETEVGPNGILKTMYHGQSAYVAPYAGRYGQLVAINPIWNQYETVAFILRDGSVEGVGSNQAPLAQSLVSLLPPPPENPLKGWRPTAEGAPIKLSFAAEEKANGLLATTYQGQTAYLLPDQMRYGQLVVLDPFQNEYITAAYLMRDGKITPAGRDASILSPVLLEHLPVPPANPYDGWRPNVQGKPIEIKNIKTEVSPNGILTAPVDGRTAYVLPHPAESGQLVALDADSKKYVGVGLIDQTGLVRKIAGDSSTVSAAMLANLPQAPAANGLAEERPADKGAGQVPFVQTQDKTYAASQILPAYEKMTALQEQAVVSQIQKARDLAGQLQKVAPADRPVLEKQLRAETARVFLTAKDNQKALAVFLDRVVAQLEPLAPQDPYFQSTRGFFQESQQKAEIQMKMLEEQELLSQDFLQNGRLLLPQRGGLLSGPAAQDVPFVTVSAGKLEPAAQKELQGRIQARLARLWELRGDLLKIDQQRYQREAAYAAQAAQDHPGVGQAQRRLNEALDRQRLAVDLSEQQAAQRDWRSADTQKRVAQQERDGLARQAKLLPLQIPVLQALQGETQARRALVLVPPDDKAAQAKAQKEINAACLLVAQAQLAQAKAQASIPMPAQGDAKRVHLAQQQEQQEVKRWEDRLANLQGLDSIGLPLPPSVTVPGEDLLGSGTAFRGAALSLLEVQQAYVNMNLAYQELSAQPGRVREAETEVVAAQIAIRGALVDMMQAEFALRQALQAEANMQFQLNQAKQAHVDALRMPVGNNPSAKRKAMLDAMEGVNYFTRQLGSAQQGVVYQQNRLAKASEGLQYQQARLEKGRKGVDYQTKQTARYRDQAAAAQSGYQQSAFTHVAGRIMINENSPGLFGWEGLMPSVFPGVAAPVPDAMKIEAVSSSFQARGKGRLQQEADQLALQIAQGRADLAAQGASPDYSRMRESLRYLERVWEVQIGMKKAQVQLLDAKTVDQAKIAQAAVNKAVLLEEQRRIELMEFLLRDLRRGPPTLPVLRGAVGVDLSGLIGQGLGAHAKVLEAERDRLKIHLAQDKERDKNGEPLVSPSLFPVSLPAAQNVLDPFGPGANLLGYVRVHGKDGEIVPVMTASTQQVWLVDPVFESGDRWAKGLRFVEKGGILLPVERTVKISGRAPYAEGRQTYSVYTIGPVGDLVTGPYRVVSDGLTVDTRGARLGLVIRTDPNDAKRALAPTHGLVAYLTYQGESLIGVITREIPIATYNKKVDGTDGPLPFEPEGVDGAGRTIFGTLYRGGLVTYGPKGEAALGGKKDETGPRLPAVFEWVGARQIPVVKELRVVYNEEMGRLEVTFRSHDVAIVPPVPVPVQVVLPRDGAVVPVAEEAQISSLDIPWWSWALGGAAFGGLAAYVLYRINRQDRSSPSAGLEDLQRISVEEFLETLTPDQMARIPSGANTVWVREIPSSVNVYSQSSLVSSLERKFGGELPDDLRALIRVVAIPLQPSEEYQKPGVIFKDLGMDQTVANPLDLPLMEIWLDDVQRVNPAAVILLALRGYEDAGVKLLGLMTFQDLKGKTYLAVFA